MAPLMPRTFGQGVGNILRFNWHFYALAAAGIALALGLAPHLPAPWRWLATAAATAAALSTGTSLGASFVVYDVAPLYELRWLGRLPLPPRKPVVVNLHAGFDETSALLRAALPRAQLRVLDFYDPARHTEPAIRRARRAYPPFAGTEAVAPTNLPLAAAAADVICLLFAAHEIRDEAERTAFFGELRRALKPTGHVVVTEHLRDWRNFAAYTIGFLHFYSRPAWLRVFAAAGLRVVAEDRSIPLVSTFILAPRAAAS